MPIETKNIAIIGANKEGLKLLPLLLADPHSRVCIIADPNKEAMCFKLNELGYTLAGRLGIKVTTDLNEIRDSVEIDIIINALQDQPTEKFLESPELRHIEKLGPLSARLIWGVKNSAPDPDLTGVDKAKDQMALLSALREIVDAVRLTIDRKELLSVILKLATESTSAERGSIMLMTEEKTLRVEIAKGMDEEVVRKIRVPLGDGVSGRVAKDAKPLLLSGKAKGAEFARHMDRRDVKSSMCVPLVVEGTVIGVINVSSNESNHVFTNEDLTFLSSLASLAAEVIQRSNEYERLRVDSAKFTFWKEADAIMSSQQPLEKRLTTVARRLSEIIQGLTCFVYIYDDERKRLFLQAASIRDGRGLGMLSLRPGEGMEGFGIDEMKDVILVDRTEDGHTKRVYLSLPMVSNETIVGTLNAQYVSTHGLSVYHEAFLKEIRTLLADSVYKFRQGEKEKLKARKMFAVDEAGLEMISIKDMKRLANLLATTPAAILGAEGSLLRLSANGSKRFQTVATYGLDDKTIREYFLPVEKETVMEVLRKKETVTREFSEDASPYIRSVMAMPLKVNDVITGVVTFFNKTSEGFVTPCGFSRADTDILTRFSVYAEKALLNAAEAAAVKIMETAPPPAPTVSPLVAFEGRVEQELNRARRQDKSLVLATVRISGLKGFANRAEYEKGLVSSIRKKTRSFDVVVRLNEETFGFLFLDTDEKVLRLLGAITDVIANDETFHRAFIEGKADIFYGYACFPREGDSFSELFSKASNRDKYDMKKTYDTEF